MSFQRIYQSLGSLELMSQTPISQKLRIKEGYIVLIINSPTGYITKLGNTGATLLIDPAKHPFDLIQVFASTKKDLEQQLSKIKSLVKAKGLIWVTYPKGKAEINRDSIREYASTVGLQAVSLVAVDDTWSALRLKAT